MKLSIVTPWHDHPELLPDYLAAVAGAHQVIVIDNASGPETAQALAASGVELIRNDSNRWFAAACNQGLQAATGSAVLFLNNDVVAQAGWLADVVQDVIDHPRRLLCASTDVRTVAGQPLVYAEGWCVAATRGAWRVVGGWDAETFQGPYWEDVDLSWRAAQLGLLPLARPWRVRHLSNTTSRTTPGAYDYSDANRRAFKQKVLASYAA